MSLSRLFKSIGRTVKAALPSLASFIPVIGPILAPVLAGIGGAPGGGGTPPIRQAAQPRILPGTGMAVPARSRKPDRGQGVRDRRAAAVTRRAPPRVTAPGRPSRELTVSTPGGGFVQGERPTGRRVIQLPPVGTGVNQMSIAAALPHLARAGQTIFRAATGRAATAAGLGVALGSTLGGGGAQGGQCAAGFHPNKQDGVGGPAGTYCVRNRRMNVGNARAARRSVRRLKGARKLLRDIEKMMPSKPSRRRAPAGHTARLEHTGS